MFRVLCCLLSTVAAYAAAPLFQASFEKPGQGWTAVRGTASPDATVLHNNNKSLRLEGVKTQPDVAVRFAPIALTIGKRYELSGWVRTEDLEVKDLDRSPIAIGAALTMASMPFDVHSASVGGTQPWTRLSLKFVATRAQDSIMLTAAAGGTFQRGKAWFEGVSLDEISSGDEWPTRDAVQTFGPAYRYPQAGWIYLHIEGAPYERGYQHGHLMAREIPEYLERCAADLGSKDQWSQYRTTANALFLRGFDKEIMEEMRGIADGASDAGAKWLNRRIDLMDIVVANVTVELGELASAVGTTATGLEGSSFDKPDYAGAKRDSVMDHCSAFAATGPATRDGKMVIGHVTWWPLTLAEQTNVMLDIKPASGHRMLIQSYPGGIESGTDWYQNDAGVVLTETTIRQTPFNAQGTPVAFRARMAIQYGGNVDEVVKQLGTRNNGLYTNEWLIGDAKNNEIAMYELGTNKTKLWRSSKHEWFGNTPGFYWGNNNAKDLDVRLENYPDPKGAPDFIPFVPGVRDLAWNDLYNKYRGQIDEQFAFLAFRTAPLVSASTMDAKVANSDLASRMMVWAEIGKPNQREWVPSQRYGYAKNDGLYPSGYSLFRAEPSDTLRTAIQENEKARLAEKPKAEERNAKRSVSLKDRLWKGWLLPASEADTWFVGGSASYYRVLESDEVEKALSGQRAEYRGLKLSPDNAMNRAHLEEVKGALFLDGLRRKMGDDAFLKLMADYFAANATKTVTAQSFLDKAGVPFEFTEPGPGPAYLTSDITRHLASAVLVYGTVREAGANRYAAEQMQLHYLDRYESEVPIYKDFEVSDELLRHHDVIFVGRPEANSALAAWAEKLGLSYDGAVFRMDGETHASEREGLVFAAKNPLDAAHMVLTVAGNDALRTVKASRAEAPAEYVLLDDGNPPRSGFIGQGAAAAGDRQGRRR
ncbi:MAG TPA: C45 family autoproteolytic acyltransferase/hydrolase [Bryobacteraceae bacterium]|nr:C45 family autoproteolytic acyltransferase/hydrolase [Bryobacteraceae bacterium]